MTSQQELKTKMKAEFDAALDVYGQRYLTALKEATRDHPQRRKPNGGSRDARPFGDENKYHKGKGPGGGQFTTGPGGGVGAAAEALKKGAAEVPHIKVPAKVEAVAKAGVKAASALALAAGIVPMTGSKAQHPNTIASRLITSKRASEAVKNTYAQPSLAAMKLDPEGFRHNIRLFRDGKFYPNFRKGELSGKPDKDAPVIIEHFKQNLKFLHDRSEGKGTTKLWYDGARNIVDHRAGKYGVKDASVAGVYAALSPKKDWDQNVHIGDRVLDIHSKMQDHKWDAKMTAKAAEIWHRPDVKLTVERLSGKRLRDLETVGDKAVWMRTFDEAHSDRHYRVVRPDGSLGDFATNLNGARSTATWQSIPSISSAVRSLEANGNRSIISAAMSDEHKVRSFYNNMLDPHSANGDTTIDTHAVGGSLLRPVSSDSAPVLHAFGSSPSLDKKPKGFVGTSSSSITGSSGTYGLYATAHREVAQELGLQPRQVQSITWVKKRDLFDSSMTDKQKAGVAQAWHDYHTDFGVSLERTQRRIMQIMGGE